MNKAALRWLVAAAFVFAVVVSGIFSGLANRAGLFFLAFGSVAAALLGFSRREIGAAFRHAAGSAGPPEDLKRSAHFWEAAARNAWIVGVLGSALNLTVVLGGGSAGIAVVSGRMVRSFIITLYGLVLAVVCLVPAVKLSGRAEKPGPGAKVDLFLYQGLAEATWRRGEAAEPDGSVDRERAIGEWALGDGSGVPDDLGPTGGRRARAVFQRPRRGADATDTAPDRPRLGRALGPRRPDEPRREWRTEPRQRFEGGGQRTQSQLLPRITASIRVLAFQFGDAPVDLCMMPSGVVFCLDAAGAVWRLES